MSNIVIPLPAWKKPPLSGNDRGHTRFSSFREVKAEARTMIRAANPRTVVGANVTLHWLIPDKGRRDADNIFATLKACLDALVAEKVLPEDSWVHVPVAACRIHPPNGEPARVWLELDVLTEWPTDPTNQKEAS